MRRSITCFGLTLGTAALIALGTGCKHENQQQPSSIGTTTTSEPNAPSTTEPGATAPQPGAQGMQGTQGNQPGQPARPGGEYGAGLPGEGRQPSAGTETGGRETQPPPQPPQPGQPMLQPPSTGEPTATAVNEKEMCDALASSAKLHIEDVQNGAAVVMVPRQGTSLSNLRDDAKKLEQSIKQPQAGGAEPCGIFALGRLPSVTSTTAEGKSSVRLVMTTSNPSEVKDLRRMAREQVGMLMHQGQKAQPRPR